MGKLYIVATPLGNLSDMTFRAVEILKSVDCIAAEDTRHSSSLLQNFSIKTPLVALHEHNERESAAELIKKLLEGQSIAIISDAGTPLISDPGYFIVREARQQNIQVVPIPGACAVITALSAAGLPSDRFTFEGFLPAKTHARIEKLKRLINEVRTMIFYETPHRIVACLEDMQAIFGEEREVTIARELTKKFETIYGSTLQNILQWIKNDKQQQKGEFVVIVRGAELNESELTEETDATLKILLEELPLKQAVELTAKISGKRKNDLYAQALKFKPNN